MAVVQNVFAGLGWSLEECRLHWGRELAPPQTLSDGREYRRFSFKGYWIGAYLLEGRVSRIEYRKQTGNFSNPEIEAILEVNAPDAKWEPTKYDDIGRPRWWEGTVSSTTLSDQTAYWAFRVSEIEICIFDQDDREHIKGELKNNASGL